MRAVVQRVSRASVTVEWEITGEIGNGLLVLLGVEREDSEADADYVADKVAGLRIFEDDAGKMNRSVGEIGGAVLAVSQFTLFGRRSPRQAAFVRCSRAARACPGAVRVFRGARARIGTALRDRPLPGDDASRAGEQRSGDDSAGFQEAVLIFPARCLPIAGDAVRLFAFVPIESSHCMRHVPLRTFKGHCLPVSNAVPSVRLFLLN